MCQGAATARRTSSTLSTVSANVRADRNAATNATATSPASAVSHAGLTNARYRDQTAFTSRMGSAKKWKSGKNLAWFLKLWPLVLFDMPAFYELFSLKQ